MFPQKVFEKERKFSYTHNAYDYFKRPVGQEKDTYDEVLKKAMLNGDRGMTITQTKTKTDDGQVFTQTKVQKTESVFKPNTFSLNLIENTKPLLDNSNTPRSAKKAITLERVFDHDVWVYNKTSLDDFAKTAKDVKKGKSLKRKIMRKQRQRSKKASPMATRSSSRGMEKSI